MNPRIKRITQASLIGMGFVLIWALLLLPTEWIYNRLAIRVAFGRDRGGQVTVESVKKPCTVTFSNGVVADVGYLPAAVSSGFFIVAVVVGEGFYFYKFRRRLRECFKGCPEATVLSCK